MTRYQEPTVLLVSWIAATAGAAAGESEPRPVTFVDVADLFTSVQFDTGYLPSATDPIAIRLFLTPIGGVTTVLNGTSEVSWPPLGHRVASEPDGAATVDLELAIGAEVQLDLAGVFTGVVPLWTEDVRFDGDVGFDGLLLPGNPVDTVTIELDDPGLFPSLEYALSVITGVELVASVHLTPTAAATVRGTGVVSEIGDVVLEQAVDGLWSDLPPDPGRPGELGVNARWTGEVDALLELVIEPEISVDTFLGSFSLVRFPIAVPLVDTVSARESVPEFLVHPLPVLADPLPAHAFGTVAVGSVTNRAVPLDNLGELLLEAELRVEGDPAFSVWPPALAATPDGPTGFVVTFSPDAPGDHEASLVVATNDPTMPLISIPLTGAAVDGGLDGPGDPTTGEGGSSPLRTCGCAASSGDAGLLGVAAGLSLVGLSRRRRGTPPGGASRTSAPPQRR